MSEEHGRWARVTQSLGSRSPANLLLAVYLVIGALWILLSDRLLPAHQTYKGLLFVGLSGAVIWWVAHKSWTARARIEERDRKLQRLESIGRLAGGIAHDFNNLLTTISGYTEMVVEALGPGTQEREDLEQVRSAADKAATLTRQLLAFSRRQPLERRIVDLNELVVGTTNMLQRLLPSNIQTTVRTADSPLAIAADPGGIEQVVTNLLVNARDALPAGGAIRVETLRHRIDGRNDRRQGVEMQHGTYAALRVTDDGTGMDAATLAQIFEPFFTTKEEGTGLGLATSYGIVKQHGGYIWASSAPGRGTTFDVYFPEAEGPVSEGRGAREVGKAASLAGKERRVLAVDDDIGVRGIMVRTLEAVGLTVAETGRGVTAARLIEEAEPPFDVVIVDLVLPGPGGRELARLARRRHPETRILYVTGHVESLAEPVPDDHPLLRKPFSSQDLLAKVREIL